MRVFQVGNIYPAHLDQLQPRLANCENEDATNAVILSDVPQAQLLAICISKNPDGRLSFPQYEKGLRHWASDNGLSSDTTLDEILLAQIENHRSEVFYSVNSARHSETFMRRMPGCVRLKVGWLGSAIVGTGLQHFDAIVSNFPTLNANHAKVGLRTNYLTPSYESQTDAMGFVPWDDRRTDLFFAGTFSLHHQNRARLIEDVSCTLADQSLNADFRLLNSRYTKMAERTPLGLFPPFSKVRRPRSVRRVAKPPVFGNEMYGLLGRTKLVLNMAIDIAGRDRGNMRSFESLSAGALMISDAGDYPEGFENGETHVTYQSNAEALSLITHYINEPSEAQRIARNGWEMIRLRYSKARQWEDFAALCAEL
ncbi:glycosyltransferase [Sulfitobacter sp. 1A15106]|uniref:glycosyltransferase family protein n=1 Tax=Sulfitobacter sp. 1A15106 TaxID=3368590 RepID=UPI0037453C8E